MSSILCFGDSITFGGGDTKGGWVQRLRIEIDERGMKDPEYYYKVYNLGISGDNTEGLLKRLETDATPRIDEEDEIIAIIIAIGTNDAQFLETENRLRISEADFRKNLEKIIKLSQKLTDKVVVVGPTRVDESKTTPIPWDTIKYYKNENIEKYNDIEKEMCEKYDVSFLDLHSKMKDTDYKDLLIDGLHPNEKGYDFMYKSIKEFLTENKAI